MEKGKYKMPSVKGFLKKKTICGPKKDPVWVYLEKEMKENADTKPYNEVVGDWLKFLRDLRYYFHCEAKRKERKLIKEVGPSWYYELSLNQREVLSKLRSAIHQDLLEDVPSRTRKALSDLGITTKIPKATLMKAMNDSVEDPGVFIWNLYTTLYKKPPNVLKPEYDITSMLLMSSLVFIDLDECVETLENLTACEQPGPPPPKPKKKTYFQPKIQYGEYMQEMKVPFYSSHPSGEEKKIKPVIDYKFKLRSEESYENLCNDTKFLNKRKERNKKESQKERVCHYKFWEPPSTLRNTDPKMAAYIEKLKMLKNKAKAKFKAPFKNVQYQIAGVAFTGGKPNYILSSVGVLPTGYIPIHGGVVKYGTEYITNIIGYWTFPRIVKEKCDATCNCMKKWEKNVMNFIKESKCQCGHLYDFHNDGKALEKYFYQPTKHGPMWFDEAKIFQMDPVEDFIKDTVRDALLSKDPTPEPSLPAISPSGLSPKQLLSSLMADISDTPLVIPHLPQASLLHNLQEWVRKRVHGKMSPKMDRRLILQSSRLWLDLKHMDFRARAFLIPFTLKQLSHMNWSHRNLIQELFKVLLNDFISRNRMKQLEQSRLWWSTMKHDAYPSKAFLDVYFTYLPGRMKDTLLLNPYSSATTKTSGAKTCPLKQ